MKISEVRNLLDKDILIVNMLQKDSKGNNNIKRRIKHRYEFSYARYPIWIDRSYEHRILWYNGPWKDIEKVHGIMNRKAKLYKDELTWIETDRVKNCLPHIHYILRNQKHWKNDN